MKSANDKKVLVSGASIAGLATAYWMNRLGYQVTVVELAATPRTAGAAVDIREGAVDVVRRMGILEQLKAHRLQVERIELKNADDVTEGAIQLASEGDEPPADDIEIERDKFLGALYGGLKADVDFLFHNRIKALTETGDGVTATFRHGPPQTFDLVLGCDGMHSGVRRLWFGAEQEYAHFLEAYFSLTIVDRLLVPQRTMQMFNVPDKAITLNAYNGKTDIICCFYAEKELPYDYRDTDLQRQMILEQFEGVGWRTAELMGEIQSADNFYFDKFCQIRMPSWTRGRVALVGDAAYCASPAAGMGASLSLIGAAALADALERHDGDFEAAFGDYNRRIRPFIEGVQATAESNVKAHFVLRTEEAIRQRNTAPAMF